MISNKKVIAPNWSTFLPVLCWFKKKHSHHLETAARKREVWVGMLGSFRGQYFCLEEHRPLLPPLVAALACDEFAGPIYASLRPGNTASFEEMLQRLQTVDNTMSDLTGPRFEPQTSRSRDERVAICHYSFY